MLDKSIFIPLNFGGLDEGSSAWEGSKAVIIPVPYDCTTSYLSGARHGPLAIIQASTHMELFDTEIKQEPASIGIHTLDQIEVVASCPEKMIERVEAVAARVLSAEKFPVLLGGEHSITLGMVRALKQIYPEMGVVQLDAHADLRDHYQESPYNHACIGRRVHELCKVSQAGIRSLSREEFDFLSQAGIYSLFADNMKSGTAWLDGFVKSLPQDVYISIDLDVLDISIMPSVGTPEPGGLGWYAILDLLRFICSTKNIVGFDIMELCPQANNPAPDFLAAKLCYKLLGYIHCR